MFHVIATYAKRNDAVVIVLSTILAYTYVVLAICQLVTFEKIPYLLQDIWPHAPIESIRLGAAFLVVAEVFSLPFLLGMQISKAMRAVGICLAYGVSVYIMHLGIATSQQGIGMVNSALGGSLLAMPGGGWLIWFGVCLVTLLTWLTVRIGMSAR